jgi:gliding motility-associated-like protein
MGGVSYQWVPSTYLNYSNISNPVSTPLNNISYVVIVSDTDGCSAKDTVNIIVDESTDLFVPTAFAPDGNQLNQILYVRGKGIKDIEFVIYDRWGEKVFETNDMKQGWDGTFKGIKLSTAVFVYYIKATYYSGEKVEKKGDVTLIR